MYVLIGLPGSGKSTWAQANAARLGAAVVASDEIRNEMEAQGQAVNSRSPVVYARVADRVAEHLDQDRSIIVDATHVRSQWRAGVVAAARQRGARCIGVWFDLPVAVCLRRNTNRPGGGWGQRPVPQLVVLGMRRVFEAPTVGEFDEVWRVARDEGVRH